MVLQFVTTQINMRYLYIYNYIYIDLYNICTVFIHIYSYIYWVGTSCNNQKMVPHTCPKLHHQRAGEVPVPRVNLDFKEPEWNAGWEFKQAMGNGKWSIYTLG